MRSRYDSLRKFLMNQQIPSPGLSADLQLFLSFRHTKTMNAQCVAVACRPLGVVCCGSMPLWHVRCFARRAGTSGLPELVTTNYCKCRAWSTSRIRTSIDPLVAIGIAFSVKSGASFLLLAGQLPNIRGFPFRDFSSPCGDS